MNRIALIILFMAAAAVAATQLDPGVTYDCGTAKFNMSFTVGVDSLQLFPNQILLNATGFSVTPSTGSTWVTLNPWTPSLFNFTEINSVSITNQHIITGATPASSFAIYRNGILEGSATSTGDGIITYTTTSFIGEANYLFLLSSGNFIISLTNPADNQQFEYTPSLSVAYVVTESSPNTVANATLYDNRTGSWANRYLNVTAGNGNKALGAAAGLGLGTVLWGAYGCDNTVCKWSATNRTYSVNDTTAPTVNVEINQTTIEADLGNCVHGMYNTTDYFPGSSIARYMKGNTVLKFNNSINGSLSLCYSESGGLGVTNLNVTSTDTSGNIGRANVTFSVQDTISPRLTLSLNVSSLEAGRDCVSIYSHSVDALPNTFSLNITNATGAVISSIGAAPPGDYTSYCYAGAGLGAYTVNLTTTDTSGNRNSSTIGFTMAKTISPVVTQISPNPGDSYPAGTNQTTLICAATDYLPLQNITFAFDTGGNVTNTSIVGGQSSRTVGWGFTDYRDYNWTCGAYDSMGLYTQAPRRVFTYLNSTVVFNCSWVSPPNQGTIYNWTFGAGHVNATVEANNSVKFSVLQCNLGPYHDECGYTATNASSIVFPVSLTPFTSCNVTVYTQRNATGNVRIRILQSDAFNNTNIGNVNWTTTKYVREYIDFGITN